MRSERPRWPWLLLVAGCSSTAPSSSDVATRGDASPAGADGGGVRTDPDGDDARTAPTADANTNGVDGGAGSTDAAPSPDATVEGGPARPSSACGASAGAAASGAVSIPYGGDPRSYQLHVPPTPPAKGAPLVISLHGFVFSGSAQETLTNMDPLADTEGFVVAYPNGEGNPANWNAGACCSAASEGDRDDKGFLGAVIDDIGKHTCLDLSRVYVMGFSNGGMMTGRLACEMSERFAAAATVSGSLTVPLDGCKPSRPIAFMHVHGNQDALVPYEGGAGGLPLSGRPTPVFPAVSAEIATFRAADGCPATSDVSFSSGNAHCDHWGPCQAGAEVTFCTIDGGAHAWPGGMGVVSTEASALDATAQIWAFFKRHALP